jgi:chloramphenicol 3-O-phosphotransferase
MADNDVGKPGIGRLVRLVLVIAGPIASGKSSLAVSVALALEQQGLRAATIDLDLMYEMLERARALKNDSVIWSSARRAAGALTKALLDDGTNVVIAEGDFLDDRARAEFVSMLPDGVAPEFITLTVPLETALVRVDQDPARGISRDRGFLARHYDERADLMRRRPDSDLCLDTSKLTLDEATQSVVQWALRAGAPD